MQVLILWELGLKMPVNAPKMFLGGFGLQNGEQINVTLETKHVM